MSDRDGISFAGDMSQAVGDGRYVRRFVGATLAADSYAVTATGPTAEVAMGNPNGAVESLLPTTALNNAWREAGDGARFGSRLKINRLNNTPVLAGTRGNGTFAAPTAPLNAEVLFQINSRPVTDTGGAGTSAVTGAIAFVARENLGAAAWGTLVRVSAGRVGAATTDIISEYRSGGAGIAEVVGGVATWRLVPLTTGQIRNPANSANYLEWNATGVGFFGATPIARPTITGSRGANAALASLLTQGATLGLWVDSTTV